MVVQHMQRTKISSAIYVMLKNIHFPEPKTIVGHACWREGERTKEFNWKKTWFVMFKNILPTCRGQRGEIKRERACTDLKL